MPLVNAKCTNCGAPLQVDNKQEAAVCQYCGSAFIVEKAIQNFNISVTNNITAQNVIIAGKGEMEKERLLQNAQTNENFKEYDKAYEIYKQVTEDYPDDYRGWYGLASMKTHKFKILDISDHDFSQLTAFIDKAMLCAPNEYKSNIKSTWDQYLENHLAFLDKKKESLNDLNSKSEKFEEQINELNDQIAISKNKLIVDEKTKIVNAFLGLMVGGVGLMILSALIQSSALVFIGLLMTIVFLILYIFLKASVGTKKAYVKANSKRINEEINNNNDKIAKLNKENSSCKESIAFLKNNYNI